MSVAPEQAYAELLAHWRKLCLFGSTMSVLSWDHHTYMPAGGAAHRGEQLALLAGMAHEMATDRRLGEWLSQIESSPLVQDPDAPATANVREIRREYDQATKLPRELVEALTRACTEGYTVWVEARQRNDFKLFQPHLEKILGLVCQQADALGWKESRYDALLDLYEPGATKAQLQALFGPLQEELARLVAAIVASGRRPDRWLTNGEYPVAAQAALARAAAEAIGFDFSAGRLDDTAHPFCSGIGPGDTRLTTRYNPRNFLECFFSVMHEAGHGLYAQGLDPAQYGTPMGQAVSLGIHESQSRMWENLVGRSRPFWEYCFPKAQRTFRVELGGVKAEEFYYAVNEARPSFIRTEADEVTYNLHVILRFELETALVEGRLAVADLPGAWNENFQRLLGLAVPDYARGCLQDVHWSHGSFGYFPTYTLGNLNAAQFFAAARRELGDLDRMLAHGEFTPLRDWLRLSVHRQGMRYRAGRLCELTTGQALSAQPMLDHLKAKFGPLYGI